MTLSAETLLAPERFARASSRRLAIAYVHGLLADLGRKNGATLGHSPEADAPSLRRLLNSIAWDVDGVRDDLRERVVSELSQGTEVWTVGTAGFPKSGTRSVGVEHQDLGDGRRQRGQRGVFLTYATPHGQALVDRELYLPDTWTDDPARRHAFEVPDTTAPATPGGLAAAMLERAHHVQGLRGTVVADAVTARDPALFGMLATCRIPTVVEIEVDPEPGTDGQGWSAWVERARSAAVREGGRSWRSDSDDAVGGTHSTQWVAVDLDPTAAADLPAGWGEWLVLRATNDGRRSEVAWFRASAPVHQPVADLLRAASALSAGERALTTARTRVGLGDYQVRHHPGWYRHVTLAMAAAALVELGPGQPGGASPWPRLRPTEYRLGDRIASLLAEIGS